MLIFEDADDADDWVHQAVTNITCISGQEYVNEI